MEVFGVVVIGIVLVLAMSGVLSSSQSEANTADNDWGDDDTFDVESSDWHTDPMYSHMPGNIHYTGDDQISSSIDDCIDHGTEDSISFADEPDIYTDPMYSHLEGNVYHTDVMDSLLDDDFLSNSGFDNDFNSGLDDDLF